MAHAIGLSVGSARLAGVAVGRAAVTRSAVLTRFPHRPPEVGLPSENPDLDERGLIITDFVDRVGDPVKIVASDGSSHAAANLLADALCSLLYAVTRGQAPVDPIGVTYPVHWRPPAVDALRRALAGLPEFSGSRPVTLVPDAVAALTALQDDPGVPTSGIIVVCDFGATGTSITLADAARDFEPIAPPTRDADLSGDVADQALLTHVIADLAAAGSVDLSDTSAIGSLTRLRSQCRAAKERLSTSSVTSVPIDLPGRPRTEVRVTRDELEDALEEPLAGFVDILYDILRRNRIHQNDLVAVASVGGGARMPIITTTLSEHLRVPVVTTGHPELNGAIGAGLEGLRVSFDDGVTSLTPKATMPPKARGLPPAPAGSAPTSGVRELAWSGAKQASGPVRIPGDQLVDPRPRPQFDGDDVDDVDDEPPTPWYRHPFALLAAGVSLVLAVTAAAAVVVLVRDDSPAPISTISTSRTTPTTTTPPERSPAPTAESTAVVPPPSPSPLDTVVEQPPPVQYTPPTSTAVVPPAPPASPSASESSPPPPPASESSPPPPPPSSEVPPGPPPPDAPAPPGAQAPAPPPIPDGQGIPAVPAAPPIP